MNNFKTVHSKISFQASSFTFSNPSLQSDLVERNMLARHAKLPKLLNLFGLGGPYNMALLIKTNRNLVLTSSWIGCLCFLPSIMICEGIKRYIVNSIINIMIYGLM